MGLKFLAEILAKRNPSYTEQDYYRLLRELYLFLSELAPKELRFVIKSLYKKR